MNIKEQELIEQHLNEASSKDYSKLSTAELKDLLTIFKNVSRSAAKPVLGAINKELNTRMTTENTEIEEAKVVPFKKLEQAWTRTNGDEAKQAKLIKKHDLKKIISTVRPGEIKLGVKNKLLGTTGAATAAGLDLDDQLIFVTNNPLKIIYPKKSTRRPEGEEIKESVDVAAARLEKMVSLVLKENDLETIKSFIENSDIDLNTAPSKIREGYKSFDLEEAKNITVRALRQMMFKIDSSAADKFRKELFKVDAQDSPASAAQIKQGKKIVGNKFGRKDFQEAKIPSSNIARFSNPQAAKRAASKQKYKTQIFMGDDDKFWVPSTNKEAGQLKKAGYEVYESADLEEASNSDIKKVLDAGKKAGGKIKGNTIDFGMGAKIDVSLEKGKIKLDGGRDGVEVFKNVKDALMAFEETQHVIEGE